MMHPDSWPLFLTLPASLGGGVLLGLVYFLAVKMTADLIVTGTRGSLTIALILGRLGLLVAGLILALQAGALALVATLFGILAGRAMTIRRTRITAA